MSDKNVGWLPPLSEEIQGFLNVHPFGYSHALGLLKRYARDAISAHGQPVVDGVPPEAVEVEGTSLLAGAVKLGDWAIPTQCGARIVDARMAYGWNECRKAMLEAIATLKGATP